MGIELGTMLRLHCTLFRLALLMILSFYASAEASTNTELGAINKNSAKNNAKFPPAGTVINRNSSKSEEWGSAQKSKKTSKLFYPYKRKRPHYFQCSPEDGGGTCPDGSICCKVSDWKNRMTTSRCVPIKFSDGCTCCSDDAGADGITGPSFCYDGYDCAQNATCIRNHSKEQLDYTERFSDVIPQYATCHAGSRGSLSLVHGLPISITSHPHQTSLPHRAAYFSSEGDVLHIPYERSYKIQAAVLYVHGYRTNLVASDYFCAAVAASMLQDTYHTDSTLVLAPWFQCNDELRTELAGGGQVMRWDLRSWEYGQAPNEPESAQGVSSFDIIDEFVSILSDSQRFPNLDLITVMGNCNGASFVQRWALFSGIPAWDTDRERRESGFDLGKGPRIRTVVLNPGDFTYLSEQRYVQGTPRCNQQRNYFFNSYPYGLDITRGTFRRVGSIPYVADALESMGKKGIAQRYASRDVIYLSASLDLDLQSQEMCPILLQGITRVEISTNYYRHVSEYFGMEVHKLIVAKGIWHDNALAIQSPNGLLAIFGGTDICPATTTVVFN